MASIAQIYRYPVKGLSAEPLTAVAVEAGKGLPLDRSFALARPGAPFDPRQPVWLRKRHFLQLMTDEHLATLDVAYDDARGLLRIAGAGDDLLQADIRTTAGRDAIEAFFAAFMGDGLRGRPRLVSAADHSFTDNPSKSISLINLASVQEIEQAVGRPVDHRRFRANLYVRDLPAWAEFDWVGHEVALGTVRLRVTERIDRCAATNVDPTTGERDLDIPPTLRRTYGHIDCGVLLQVVEGGQIALGQTIAPVRSESDGRDS